MDGQEGPSDEVKKSPKVRLNEHGEIEGLDMPESTQHVAPLTPEDEEPDTIEDGRPSDSLRRLADQLKNAKPFEFPKEENK